MKSCLNFTIIVLLNFPMIMNATPAYNPSSEDLESDRSFAAYRERLFSDLARKNAVLDELLELESAMQAKYNEYFLKSVLSFAHVGLDTESETDKQSRLQRASTIRMFVAVSIRKILKKYELKKEDLNEENQKILDRMQEKMLDLADQLSYA